MDRDHISRHRPSQRPERDDTDRSQSLSITQRRSRSPLPLPPNEACRIRDVSSHRLMEESSTAESSVQPRSSISARSRGSAFAEATSARSSYRSRLTPQTTNTSSTHRYASPTSTSLARQRSVARHTTHTPPPRPSVPCQTYSDFSIEGEQVRESIAITNGRAHIDQSRAASAQQPNLLSASPADVLKLIEDNEQLLTLLTQGFGNRHDPHSDHRSEDVALHDPRYKEAEVQSGKTIASLIAAINLGKNHWHSSWDPLAEEAETSVSPYVSGPMRIGIVGETGQGKSCLIGGLLGDEGIVQTAKSGESLTRVILEYHHWNDHDSRFKYRAIITLLPWESVQKRIETYFEHWNHGLLSHEDESEHEDEEGDQSPDPAGPDSPGADTETATGVFQALFRGDPSFEDEETMKDYLLSSEKSPVRHDIRDRLVSRARDMYDELDCQDTNIYKRTTEELWHELARFTHGRSADDSRGGCDAWPFVEVVEIGGPFALSEHIVIADTPGRNDLNRLARASVDDYLPSCSSVIIACNISRIISDDSLPNQIEKIQHHRPVTVVATFSEDVSLVPSRHTKLSPGEKHTYMRLHEKLKQLEREDFQPRTLDQSSLAEAILRNQLTQKHVKKAIAQVLVEERSRRVKERLMAEVRGKGRPQAVFCVSAFDYQRNIRGVAAHDSALLPLSPNNTEIPALKRHLISLCSPMRVEELVRYVGATLPGLVLSMEMGIKKRTDVFQVKIEGGVEKLSSTCVKKVHRCIDDVFEDRIEKPLLETLRTQLPAYIQHAEERCEVWLQWHHNTHKTFVSNLGNYKRPRKGKPSWNHELLEQHRISLNPIFQGIHEVLCNSFELVKQEIMSATGKLAEDIRKQYPPSRPAEMDLLLGNIYIKGANIMAMKTKCIGDLRTFIEKQRLRCLTDTDDISYFGYAMIDVYTASKEIRRGNKKEETRKVMQHRTFKRLLRDEETTPYHAIHVQLEQAIKIQKQLIKEYLEDKIGSLFQAIGDDLKRLGVEQASLDHGEDREVRKSIGRTLSKAKEDLRTIEALLKKTGVDCDGIKDQLT